MTNELTRTYIKLQKITKDLFSKPFEFESIIQSIEPIAGTISASKLVVKLSNEKIVECFILEPMLIKSGIHVGVNVVVRGYFKFVSANFGKIFLVIERIYSVAEKDLYNKASENYGKLGKILENTKHQCIIDRIRSRAMPVQVINIGLIIPADNTNNVAEFKKLFQEKCVGKLVIFKINDCDCISKAIEYFKKYHDIDIIFLLFNQLTLKQVYDLSSCDNVKYMINRRKTPYIVSINAIEPVGVYFEPLVTLMANKKINGLNNSIDFIHDIQTSYRTKIENGIAHGIDLLHKLSQHGSEKITQCKLLVAELLDPRYLTIEKSINKLKILLSQKLNREIHILNNIRSNINRNIMDDNRIKQFFNALVDSEKQKAVLSPTSTINPSAQKETALHQNQYFQQHPNQITNAAQTMDAIISDLENSFKTNQH